MLIIRSSLSIEDLRNSIVSEYLNRRGDDRDAFLEGAEFALDQLGISFADLSRYSEESIRLSVEQAEKLKGKGIRIDMQSLSED